MYFNFYSIKLKESIVKLSYFLISTLILLSFIPFTTILAQDRPSIRGTVFGGLELDRSFDGGLNYNVGIVQRGDVITGSFYVRHEYDTDESIFLTPLARDFVQANNSNAPVFLEEEQPFNTSLSQWTTFQESVITLETYGVQERINFTITIPEDATPGSKNAGFLAARITEDDIDSEGNLVNTGAFFSINARTGPLMFLTVDGNLTADLETTNIYTTNIEGTNTDFLIPNLYFNQPVNLNIDFANNGNINVEPRGLVFLHSSGNDYFVNPIAQFELNPLEDGVRKTILANGTRLFTFPWDDGFIVKNRLIDETTREPRIERQYAWDNLSNFRIGQYTFTVQYDYVDATGNNVETEILSTSFWIVPWEIILIVLLLVSYIIYRVWKAQNKR